MPSVSELGVVITEHAPSGVASSPRLALSPKHGVVVAEHALSGVASLLSIRQAWASSTKPGVVVIVAAIDNGATTKQCFVCIIGRFCRRGLASGNRKDLKCVIRHGLWSVVCGLWSVVCL